MRFFLIPLKDPVGNQVTYMTGEKRLNDLIGKYGTVTNYLKKAGFDQIRVDGAKPAETAVEPTTQGDTHHCRACGKEMTFKQGTSKAGKDWKGWFCQEKDHEVQWAK